jgi:CheY-like chemotaxis protein
MVRGAMPAIPRILHIDDNDDDRLLFRRAFQVSGLKAELVSFPDAYESLIFLDQAGTAAGGPLPRLIVLDLTLPHVDGRDFLGFLRTSPRYQSIPLIVLTGSSRMSDKQRCESLQVERYVVKPFTTAQLAALIRGGRDPSCPGPPAQIRTGAINAYGSHLR